MLRARIEQNASNLIAIYICIFLITGIATLPYYGLTWDEGLGNLFFGERYAHYFTSFNEVNLDFKAELDYNRAHALNLFHSPFRDIPFEFPPVADTLGAASMYLFAYTLGWLNPLDAFHLFTVLLAAGFLWVFYNFAAPRTGKFAAFIAVIFLSLFPRFWGDMHFNGKDVPQTIFFGFTIIAYLAWLQKPSWLKAVLTGALLGLALGIKANAVFIPVVLALGLIPWSADRQAWRALFLHIRSSIAQYAVMGLSTGLLYAASWPYLYDNPIVKLKSYWSYILSQGDRQGGAGFNLDPLRQVVFSMPEIMLAALLIGMVLAFRRVGQPTWRIFIVWLALPILRASLPGTVNFDGIRHFLEFLPAAALLAGYGAARLCGWVSSLKWVSLSAARAVFALLVVVNFFSIYRTYFPYLHVYYNQASGGLAGARGGWLGPEAGDYWNSSYRQGMNWLAHNAPGDSTVIGMTAGWLVDLSAPLFLPPNFKVMMPEHMPDFNVLDQSVQPIYLMFVIRNSTHLDELAYCQKRKSPVYAVNVDGVPILQIFQFGLSVP